MKMRKFSRKPFEVEAIQITEENMAEVAEWCGGHIVLAAGRPGSDGEEERYIRVPVQRAISTRQKQGFVGDWVLKSPQGFKVYLDGAMERSFDEVGGESTNLFDKPKLEDPEKPEDEVHENMSKFFGSSRKD